MYNCAFVYNYYMHRWHGSTYVSMYTIGQYMGNLLLAICVMTGMHIYVDTSEYQQIIILLLMSHKITTSSLL